MRQSRVELNYDYYTGEDLYSDGDEIESLILDACETNKINELLYNNSDYAVMYHLSSLRENIVEWYPIDDSETVLEIGSGCGAITRILSKRAKKVTCIELSKRRSMINAKRNPDRDNIEIYVGNFQDVEPHIGKYDVITLIGVWEYSGLYISESADENPYLMMLSLVKNHLNINGRLFIAIENKTGMKYFNGAYEDHTGKMYSGLNDYTENENVRTFSRHEIEELLQMAGYDEFYFYYPMPDYKFPEVVYSDDYLPREGEIRDFGKNYDLPRFYNYLDATIFDQVCHDGMFTYFANSFVVTTGKRPPVVFAKYNKERIADYRVGTIIFEQGGSRYVKKIPLDKHAIPFVSNIKNHETILADTVNNINIVVGNNNNDEYITEYVNGDTLDLDFYPIRHNINRFIDLTKEYVDAYLKPKQSSIVPFYVTDSFVKIFGSIDVEDIHLRAAQPCNIDLCFHNMKRQSNGDVAVYDLEWVFEFPIPYEFSIWRATDYLYSEYYAYLKNSISKVDYLNEIGINNIKQKLFSKMENSFLEYIMGKNRKEAYTLKYKKHSIMQQVRIYV